MNWDDAKYLLAVARTGQMLGAARRLGVNQATLSRRVTALEQSLGTTLLHRRTNGCDLTDEGLALLPRLERIEAEFLSAQSEMTGERAQISGTVRLGAPDGFGITFFAPRLTDFVEAYPAINLQLVPVAQAFSLTQREADIAVMVGRPETGKLIARKLTDYSLGVYATRGYLDKHGTPQTVEDLDSHRLIGYVGDLIASPSFNYTLDAYKGWTSSLEISSAVGQFAAVQGGAGVGVIHDFMAIEDDNLVKVLPDIRLVRSYWIAWHEALKEASRIRAVVDFVTDTVRRSADRFQPGR